MPNTDENKKMEKEDKQVSNSHKIVDPYEFDVIKDLYENSQRNHESFLERKRHLEIKSLYVMQASAVLVTLFTALLGYIWNGINSLAMKIAIVIIVIFYILILVAIICFLVALDDTIAGWFKSKEKKEKNSFHNPPKTIDILKTLKGNYDLTRYYKLMTDAIDESQKSGDIITRIKANFFHIGLRVFAAAVVVVIFLGILVA